MMNEGNESLIEEIKITNRLLAQILIKDTSNQTERVVALNQSGFAPKDIADLLKIKPNVVTATLSNVKRAEAQNQKRGR
jgi:DNA-binding CsgD family transcriptional regulator